MARTVADLRILFEVMAGRCSGDPLSAPIPVHNNYTKNSNGIRIGILENPALSVATLETQQAISRAANLLAARGFPVEPLAVSDLDAALKLWWFFFGPVIADLFGDSVKGQESLLSPMFKEYLEICAAEPPVTLQSFQSACTERDAVRANILRQLKEVPILLSPVSTAPAFPHGAGNYRAGDPHNYRDTMRHCQWLNLTGFPGLSLPMGRSTEGLPINVQLIARPFEEDLLLSVAQSLEEARGPWQPPPELKT